MFNNQKETDLQNFKTDEFLIDFFKTTTDSAHLRCTRRLCHKTDVAVSHSLLPNLYLGRFIRKSAKQIKRNKADKNINTRRLCGKNNITNKKY